MAGADDTSSGRQRRVDVRIKIALKYPDRETFVARFSHNLSRTGIFIRASDPPPVGSRIHFEYRLRDDSRILRGSGIVRWARRPEDAEEPHRPPGMGLEFIDLDQDSDQLIHQIVARHGEGSRAPVRKRRAPVPPPPSPGNPPALSLEAASLDPEEENALDALLGGDGLDALGPAAERDPGETTPRPLEAGPADAESDAGTSSGPEEELRPPFVLDTGVELPIEDRVEPPGALPERAGVPPTVPAGSELTEVEIETVREAALRPETGPGEDVELVPVVDPATRPAGGELESELERGAEPRPVGGEIERGAEPRPFAGAQAPELAPTGGPQAPVGDAPTFDVEVELSAEAALEAESTDPDGIAVEVELPPEAALEAGPSDADTAGTTPSAGDDDELHPGDAGSEVGSHLLAGSEPPSEAEAEWPAGVGEQPPEAAGGAPGSTAQIEVELDPAEIEVSSFEETATPSDEITEVLLRDQLAPAPAPKPAAAGLDESALAEFDDVDDVDEAPEARAAAGDLTGLEGAALSEFDDGFGPEADECILDLSGAAVIAATVAGELTTTEIRLAVEGGRVVLAAHGIPVRNLIGWAGRPWPSAYAHAAARRSEIELTDTEEQVVIGLGGATVPVWDAVDAVIDRCTASFGSSPPATAHVVVPSSTSEAVRDMLRDRLTAAGVRNLRLVPDALALLGGAGLSLDPGHWGLVATVDSAETRVALLRGPDEIVTTQAAPDLGLLETDRILTDHCATLLALQHELDVRGDPALLAELGRQVASCRRAGATPWELTVAGASVSAGAELVDAWTLPWRERIAVTCEALLSTHGGELAAPSAVLLACEENAWPHLAETLGDLLGAETQVAALGHAGRRAGLR